MSLQLTYSNEDEKLFSQEYWENIIRCKKEFLELNKDPRENPFVKYEIAQSWIESKSSGINPDHYSVYSFLSEQELHKIQEDNKLLIEVAKPLIDTFLELTMSTGYKLQLFDKNCFFIAGNRLDMDIPPSNRVVRDLSTTAHRLCILYKRTFQLVGPEHYLTKLNNYISTGAPIFDENGEIIGALVLIQELLCKPWEKHISYIKAHSLGWVNSLAIAIGTQYKLHKTNQILEATFELFDEGILTLDTDGRIIRANREGCRILDLDYSPKKEFNISDYLSNKSPILQLLQSKANSIGKHVYIEEFITVNNKEKPYLISVIPVTKSKSNDIDYLILRLNNTDKINNLVTKRSGASATIEFKDIIGTSDIMTMTKNQAQQFALSQENILLLGESGTGKELFAQAIHNFSRPHGPFIAVNCAAMPRNLIESELFGYESGSFTGAAKNGRPGKIELANGGTLFLDEIGDMPYELQAMLLRVLQNKEVMRLGAQRYQKVDFRLIAATNKDLTKLVENRQFRDDLYFRLSVLTIRIPPLAQRGEDKLILAEHFIKTYAQRMGFSIPLLSDNAKHFILTYSWPGNVRELENTIIYAVNMVNMSDTKIIDINHFPANYPFNMNIERPLVSKNSFSLENQQTKDLILLKNSIKDIEKKVIEEAIVNCKYKMAKAAELLGMSKSTLYRKVKALNITFRDD